MCAGVQNESRPMDICQEISQCPPIKPLAIPATMHQTVHGTDSTVAEARSPALARKDCPKGMLSAMAADPACSRNPPHSEGLPIRPVYPGSPHGENLSRFPLAVNRNQLAWPKPD